MRRALPAILSLAALAGCVPPARVEPPAPRPAAPRPAALPTPAALAPDWNDWPRTPGTWAYRRDGYSTMASYTAGGIAISCDNDRLIRLRLDGRTSLLPLTIRTSSTTRTLNPAGSGHPPTGIAAALAATDPLLDAIAFSRGRFTVEQPGSTPLVLPPYAEIDRVIEDCRG